MTADSASKWRAKKLNELGFVGRGKSKHRPRNDPTLYGGPYPFFQTGDIKAADLYLHRFEQTYNEKGLSQSKLWEPGTLCITIAANIADTAILRIPGCFPDSVVGFIPDPLEADVRFVKYYIDMIKLRMQSVSKGTTQDNLSLDKLLTFDFVVPEIKEQRRIADILSAYDDLIENNTRRIAILEEMARAIYREWFVNFRLPGHEHVKMVQSGPRLVPEGWVMTTLDRLAAKMTRAFSKQEHRDLPLLDLARIPRRSSAIEDLGSADELTTSRVIFRRGEVLFGAIRPHFHKVVAAPCDGITNTSVFVCTPRAGIPASFLFSVLFDDDTVAWASQHSSGTKMPVINWNVFTRMPVLFPTRELLSKFDSVAQPILEQTWNLVHRNGLLRSTRALLLPKLISGEIDASAVRAELVGAAV